MNNCIKRVFILALCFCYTWCVFELGGYCSSRPDSTLADLRYRLAMVESCLQHEPASVYTVAGTENEHMVSAAYTCEKVPCVVGMEKKAAIELLTSRGFNSRVGMRE